ncbi:MAG: Mov34/MPN/PAD-1 family protein, partial [Nitrospinota bacterium]
MLDHARTEYPRECVGAIIGKDSDSTKNRLIRLSNVQ